VGGERWDANGELTLVMRKNRNPKLPRDKSGEGEEGGARVKVVGTHVGTAWIGWLKGGDYGKISRWLSRLTRKARDSRKRTAGVTPSNIYAEKNKSGGKRC